VIRIIFSYSFCANASRQVLYTSQKFLIAQIGEIMITRTISFFLAAFLTASFANAQMIAENTTVRLGDHTYAIPDQSMTGVPNVGIVIGERASLVIDSGMGKLNGEIIMLELTKLSDNTEIYLATTHYHPEHTTGLSAFPASAKYINSNIQQGEYEENVDRVIGIFSGRSELNKSLLSDVEHRTVDITFDREYSLDLGGVTVDFVVVGPTHTKGDTAFFVNQDQVLFAGDVVMTSSFVSANQGSSLTAWYAALDLLDTMQPQVIVPAHGDIGDGSHIATLRGILQTIQARALELKADGMSAEDTAERVRAEMVEKYPDWSRARGVGALASTAWGMGN